MLAPLPRPPEQRRGALTRQCHSKQIDGPKMSEHLTPIRLYEQVVLRLRGEVIAGRLRDGDKLPSENELARHFGVSRTAIREAIKALVEQGAVVVRPGSGTYVARLGERPLRRSLEWLAEAQGSGGDAYLVELRQLLEPGVCALAAQRISEEQLLDLATCLQLADSGRSDPEAFIDADMRFHRTIAEASANPLVGSLLDSVGELLRSQRMKYFSVPSAPERAQRHHRVILEMLVNHDVDGARAAMDEHLQQVARDVEHAALSSLTRKSHRRSRS